MNNFNKKLICFLFVCGIFVTTIHSQNEKLSGIVSSYLQQQLNGCIVTLNQLGLSDTTQNGLFEFTGLSTPVIKPNGLNPPVWLQGEKLYIKQQNKPVWIFLYNMLGKEIAQAKLQVKDQIQSFNPLSIISNPIPHTLYSLVVKSENKSFTYKIYYRGGAISKKIMVRENPNSLLKKSRAVVDTLVVECAGFTPEEIPIINYNTTLNNITVSKPNILILFVDDMGFSDIGSYGSEIATPTLDDLAANGVRFTQFYNTSKCFPSRASLLTGAYASQVGMNGGPGNISNGVTIGEVLRQNGYRTLASGKHHGTQNLYDMGFDRYFGLRDGACNFFNPGVQRAGEPAPANKGRNRVWCIDDVCHSPYTPPESDFYVTDYTANYAIQYLDDYKNENKPFLLYVSFTAPHDPLMAWPEDIAKYRGKYTQGWEAVRNARYQKQVAMGLLLGNANLTQSEFSNWDNLSTAQKDEEDLRMAIYAAMIDRVDQNVDRIITKLKEVGKYDNTLILFASDNGGSAENAEGNDTDVGERGSMTRWTSLKSNWANASNTPFLKFKNWSHEGGITTPLIAHWPKVIKNKGGIIREPGHLIDFMATFVDITQANFPTTYNNQPVTPMQGISLYPLLRGKPGNSRNDLFWNWANGKAVREGKWKAVTHNSTWMLFDLSVDRSESNNLAGSNPTKLNELVQKWNTWNSNL